MLNNLLIPLTTGGSTASNSGGLIQLLTMFVPIIAIMYFLLIRPQKKKEKKERAMRSNIQVGDEVTTAGGIVGIVFSIKEDTLVIETGGDRSKIRVKRWAIAHNETIHENIV